VSEAVPVSFKAAAGNLLGHPRGEPSGDTRSSPPSLVMIFLFLPALTSISITRSETQVKPLK